MNKQEMIDKGVKVMMLTTAGNNRISTGRRAFNIEVPVDDPEGAQVRYLYIIPELVKEHVVIHPDGSITPGKHHFLPLALIP